MQTALRGLNKPFVSLPLVAILLFACDQSPSFVATESNDRGTADSIAAGTEQAINSGDAVGKKSNVEKATEDALKDALKDSMGGAGTGDAGGGKQLGAVEKTFQATVKETAAMSLAWSGSQVEQEVVLANLLSPTKLSYTQASRPQHTEMFAQGSMRQDLSESFLQSGSGSGGQGVLDVVLVVDNSGSMTEEQQNLSTKLAPLLEYVKDSNWKIGVVTTDPLDGCLRALVSKGDANMAQAFATAVSPGITGSGNERGILQAVNGLKGTCNPQGSWLRPNSTVAVLIVSDEDNCSANGSDCPGEAYAAGSFLTDYLNSIRTAGTNARVYGLVRHPSQTAQECPTAANKAVVYSDVIDKTKGTWGSICAADYGPTLMAISKNISVILKSQFALKYPPYANSLKVYVNGALQNTGYSLAGNVVTFQTPPAQGATVKFDYQFFADPPKTDFVLAQAADVATLEMFVDGAALARSLYTYDVVTHMVRFATAPEGREVKAVFRLAGGLIATFAIPDTFIANSLVVTVGGIASTSFTMAVDKKSLTFGSAPTDGALIELAYAKVGDPILSYNVVVPEGTLVKISDRDGSAITGARIEGSRLVVDAVEHRAGRKLVVAYENPMGGAWQLDLAKAFIRASLAVSGSEHGMCDPAKVAVSGTVIDVTACGFATTERVTVAFDRVLRHDTSFAVDDPVLAKLANVVAWVVKVDGVATTDFERTNNVIAFHDLPIGSIVTVVLTFPVEG